jgi:hypothetical protein
MQSRNPAWNYSLVSPALLSVPVRVDSRWPVTRGALWLTVLAAGPGMGILAMAAFLAIGEFVAREGAGDD